MMKVRGESAIWHQMIWGPDWGWGGGGGGVYVTG